MGPREDAQRRQDDEALREEDVTAADRLDDRVSEAEGLEPEPTPATRQDGER